MSQALYFSKQVSHGARRAQVVNHTWVITRGGLVPRLLNPNVTRGAANVASVRRLRNLVHGAIALKSLRALKVHAPSKLYPAGKLCMSA